MNELILHKFTKYLSIETFIIAAVWYLICSLDQNSHFTVSDWGKQDWFEAQQALGKALLGSHSNFCSFLQNLNVKTPNQFTNLTSAPTKSSYSF